MRDSNFDFLSDDYFMLYELGVAAESQVFLDADTTLYKIRKMGEELVKLIFIQEGLPVTDDFYHNLIFLEKANILDPQILRMLNVIRLKGNKSVHENLNSVFDAKTNLFYIFKVSSYFYKKYVNPRYTELPYFERRYQNTIGKPHMDMASSNGFASKKAFFDQMMQVISNLLVSHIIKIKRNGYGLLEEIPSMSFFEFYTYYMDVLDIIASEGVEFVNALVQFRKIIEEQLQSGDPTHANQQIALMIYNTTHWVRT